MIPTADLKKLIKYRLKDAEVLFAKRRYYASIYMSGYSIELALKYKICRLYNFTNGFPENSIEFQSYISQTRSNSSIRQTISHIRQIRHHDLPSLLTYSGDELYIIQNLYSEWITISNWNPEMRYKIAVTRKAKAENILVAVKIILNYIL